MSAPESIALTPPTTAFSALALDYFKVHAIDPAVAETVGVREVDGAFVYPYEADDGSLFERKRPLDGDTTYQPANTKQTLWWPDGKPKDGLALVCEGESDTQAALSAMPLSGYADGNLGVVGVPGTGLPIHRLAHGLKEAGIEEAILALDGDTAGRSYTTKATAALSEVGIRVIDLRIRDGYDLADCLFEAEDRAGWLSNAIADAEAVAAEGEWSPPESKYSTTEDFGSTTKESVLVEPNAKLAFAPISQALADVPAEPEWAWRGYVAPRSITLIAGRPKVGKSTLAFGALEAFSNGSSFADLDVAKSKVLLLSEERPDTLAEKHRRFNLDGSVDLLMRHEARDTPWAQVVAQAVEHCQQHGISVLVVDTWDKWAGLAGDAENSAGHVLAALEPLQRAAAAGLAVVIVAHQRKAHGSFGEAVRGNNALTGGVDVVVEVERPSSDSPPSVRILRAVSRFAVTPEELALELTETGYSACGDEETVRTRAEKARAWDVLNGLEAAATVKEVAEATGLSESTARRRLNELVEDNHALRSGEGGKKDPLRWTVSEIGSTNPYLLGGGTNG